MLRGWRVIQAKPWDGPEQDWSPKQPTVQGLLWAGTDAEETILNAFKMLDPDGKGSINKD